MTITIQDTSSDATAEGTWFPAAKIAVDLTREWALDVTAKTGCEVLLFGSSIYKNGDQFDEEHSDLDIVCILPPDADALRRVNILKELYALKRTLEVKMIPTLHRISCIEPGVSIVAITNFELRTNVHKSGVRRFFDRNYFYDFSENRARLLSEAGTQYIVDAGRHALEYVQRVRSEFLAVSANDTGGLLPFSGTDPLPKALLRSAAQLNPNAQDGEWYDTILGLELVQAAVQNLRSREGLYLELASCLSVRRRGRGHERALTADEQLLLGEILVDEVIKLGVEDAVTFQVRVVGPEHTPEMVKTVFQSLSRFAPGAKLTGDKAGSIVLQVSAPESSLENLKELEKHGVLHELLHVSAAEIFDGPFNDTTPEVAKTSRISALLSLIQEWKPLADTGRGNEFEFMSFLSEKLIAYPILKDATILNGVQIDTTPRFELDFLLTWRNTDGVKERIAIEVTTARSTASLFDVLTRFKVLGQTVILILIGGERLLERVDEDLRHYAKVNANIRVVSVPAPPRLTEALPA